MEPIRHWMLQGGDFHKPRARWQRCEPLRLPGGVCHNASPGCAGKHRPGQSHWDAGASWSAMRPRQCSAIACIPRLLSWQNGGVEFVSAEEVFEAVRLRMEDFAESRRVGLELLAGPGGLWGDRRALIEALGNIVKNAVESSGAGDSNRCRW
jgi:hypothetical protein